MNAWNPTFARNTWRQSLGFLSRVEEDRVNLNTAEVAHSIRQLVHDKGTDPDSPETIRKAVEMAKSIKFLDLGYADPNFGYVLQWASEVGDQRTLDGLLTHADKFMSPKFERGGLFYPSALCPQTDDEGNYVQVDTYTGNAAIGYARLNVSDGQRIMFEKPWTKDFLKSRPYIENIVLGDDVDCVRATWDDTLQALVLTMRSRDGHTKRLVPMCLCRAS
jgi:hypothetical protein